MNTCDSCKWWTDEGPSTAWPMFYRACRCPRVTTEEHGGESVRTILKYEFRGKLYEKKEDIPCSLAEWNSEVHWNKIEEADADGALAAAGDYYPADFRTGPKFGCVHHQPK